MLEIEGLLSVNTVEQLGAEAGDIVIIFLMGRWCSG
jgi:hypothetical protein